MRIQILFTLLSCSIAALGQSAQPRYGMLYTDIPAWEDDMFKFLDQYVKQ